MDNHQNLDNKFVGYEYQTVTVPKELDGMWVDSMKAFGWVLEKQAPAVVKHVWGPLRVMMAPLAVFMGISVFSYLAAMTPAFIIAAVPGFLGCIIPFFAYKSLVSRKTKLVDPQIESQHDNIYSICQKASETTCVA